MKTIGIIGSRRRNSEEDFKQLEKKFLEIYKDGDAIVSGGCATGGDRYAEILAKKYQVTIKIYYAQWDKIGKGAGFARNTYIAKDSDVLISLCASDRTGGAEDTIKKATKMNKEIIILMPPEASNPPNTKENNDILDLSI